MQSRTFTGAWIETVFNFSWADELFSRTFTGAWIETPINSSFENLLTVAPLQVRGLKHTVMYLSYSTSIVAPLQVRGLKLVFLWKKISPLVVAPLQVRGLKLAVTSRSCAESKSHLYRCVDWTNLLSGAITSGLCRTFTGAWIETLLCTIDLLHNHCRTFTGAWIETDEAEKYTHQWRSHLYRCVDWNFALFDCLD